MKASAAMRLPSVRVEFAELNRLKRGQHHRYYIDGTPVPGVTTIAGVLDKSNALKIWAARTCAGYAIEHWTELSDLPMMDRAKRIEDAPKNYVSKKAAKGTRIHALGERLARGERVQADDELLGPAQAYAKFLDRWDIETIALEAPAASTRYMYAGTLDLLAYAPKLGNVLIDIKTTGRVYSEVSLQLAGYRFADIYQEQVEKIGPRGGRKTEYVEHPMIPIDGCYVAHVIEDDVTLVPVEADEQIWRTFLHLREVWEFKDRTDFKGQNNPTVHEPIWPEQYADAESADAVAAPY